MSLHLTNAQYLTLKAAIVNETDPTFVAFRIAGDDGNMAGWFNTATTFVVWKSNVTLTQVGNAFNGTEFANLTTANVSRLSALADFSSSGLDPSKADRRQMLDDIFSGAGGANTRASLLALYKRFANRFEKVFATGTGTDATPATLVLEGSVGVDDVVAARTAT